ncbi:hypothetical protein NWI01_21410 [Nitrobacter winogradskyi]|uniref:Uncharacterized protein n=1 Tax=Nitrobacter winogradskyi TaxID=913 RepID=A0A4Y3WEM9_NITWI|nr:hypothetical protein NWI01_21410 [Nitrobacter winogradskyi]
MTDLQTDETNAAAVGPTVGSDAERASSGLGKKSGPGLGDASCAAAAAAAEKTDIDAARRSAAADITSERRRGQRQQQDARKS